MHDPHVTIFRFYDLLIINYPARVALFPKPGKANNNATALHAVYSTVYCQGKDCNSTDLGKVGAIPSLFIFSPDVIKYPHTQTQFTYALGPPSIKYSMSAKPTWASLHSTDQIGMRSYLNPGLFI
jgi:hypothetical protein